MWKKKKKKKKRHATRTGRAPRERLKSAARVAETLRPAERIYVSNPDVGLRIGKVAASAGVSSRTLRYYEELGLVTPSARRPGGERRYSEKDLARLFRVRELQSVMGFNLQVIQTILEAEDRLRELREEFDPTMPPERRQAILTEAIATNSRLRAQVRDRLEKVQAFVEDLEDRTERLQSYLGHAEVRCDGAPATPVGNH